MFTQELRCVTIYIRFNPPILQLSFFPAAATAAALEAALVRTLSFISFHGSSLPSIYLLVCVCAGFFYSFLSSISFFPNRSDIFVFVALLFSARMQIAQSLQTECDPCADLFAQRSKPSKSGLHLTDNEHIYFDSFIM